MPYLILIRADNNERIEKKEFTRYNAVPAEHMNLDGDQKFIDSGFTSTFEHNPEDPTVFGANNKTVSRPYRAINDIEGQLCPYRNIHFIIIHTESFGNNQVQLSGGTRGWTEDGKGAKLDGSIWEEQVFDKNFPQVFRTEKAEIQLPSN